MAVTKEQYIELVSSGSVPVPKNKKDFILILKQFGKMDGAIEVASNESTENEIDDLVLRLIKHNGKVGYLSYVKKDAKRRKMMRSALDKNESAFSDSIARLISFGEIELSPCGKRYKIA